MCGTPRLIAVSLFRQFGYGARAGPWPQRAAVARPCADEEETDGEHHRKPRWKPDNLDATEKMRAAVEDFDQTISVTLPTLILAIHEVSRFVAVECLEWSQLLSMVWSFYLTLLSRAITCRASLPNIFESVIDGEERLGMPRVKWSAKLMICWFEDHFHRLF